VAAALYASGLSYQQIEPLAISVSEFELLDLVFSRQGVVNGKALAAWVREVTGGRQIGELPVPLGIAVTDLVEGRALLIVDGDLGEAVQASASVPGTVVPVHSRGTIYVDGGVLTVLPVRFARAMGANIVIGVDIYCGKHPDPRGNAIDTLLKSFRLQTCALGDAEAAEADFLIRPGFEPTSPTSFSQRDEAVLAGYQAMKAELPALLIRMAQPEGGGKSDQ
jgi:NTE family protein